MKLLFKLSSLVLLASLTACGGDSSDSDNSNSNSGSQANSIPENIQGYYEKIVTADNGDEIVVTMAVKPDGEYFGSFNNYSANTTDRDKEIFSVYSGNFSQTNSGITTLITEFDDADYVSTIRKYPASATYLPQQELLLNLKDTDSSIDQKIYSLDYVDFEGKSLDDFTGDYINAITQIAFDNKFSSMNISDTNQENVKSLSIGYGQDCRFEGKITDNNYDVSFYDYEGRLIGSSCPNNDSFHGVSYVLNNIFILMGTNESKTIEMRTLKLGFNS